jgi:hypothetical protein
MRWVTRAHVHVDRVACPWLIRRFIDSEAEFLFVAKAEVQGTAKETGAVPFDVAGAELGHHDGKCTFEAILSKYNLADPGLARLARIVHAADVADDLRTDEIAPGLDAIATGCGLVHLDDHANLEIQFHVYDALYAWCRLQVARESGEAR